MSTLSSPIFTAIAAHKATVAALLVLNETDGTQDQFDDATDRESEALYDVLETIPTSVEGAAELLAYVATPSTVGEPNETILQTGMGCSYTEAVAQHFPALIAVALRRMERGS